MDDRELLCAVDEVQFLRKEKNACAIRRRLYEIALLYKVKLMFAGIALNFWGGECDGTPGAGCLEYLPWVDEVLTPLKAVGNAEETILKSRVFTQTMDPPPCTFCNKVPESDPASRGPKAKIPQFHVSAFGGASDDGSQDRTVADKNIFLYAPSVVNIPKVAREAYYTGEASHIVGSAPWAAACRGCADREAENRPHGRGRFVVGKKPPA